MAASTGPREAGKKASQRQAYQIGAVKINKGTLVYARPDGYAYPARTLTAIADVFLGVAFETVDNSAGVAGAVKIMVEKEGSYIFVIAAAVQANVGAPVYGSDDQTVTLTTGSTVILTGYIQDIVDTTDVRVRINRAVQ